MNPRKSERESPLRLPIKLDSATNGEYFPPPVSALVRRAVERAHLAAGDRARKLGISRREFLTSSCGAATVLLSINEAAGCQSGGSYNLPKEAAHEPEAADSVLAGGELVFDVQTHHVSTERAWWDAERPTIADFLRQTPTARCGAEPFAACFGRDAFLKEVFLDSDTDIAVLSALWGTPEMNAIHVDEIVRTRERVAQMEGSPRLLVHGLVYGKAESPAQNAERMHALAQELRVDAFKLYPVWSPDGLGYRLDDPATGMRLIEAGLATGISRFAVHKGLRLPGMERAFASCLDVGPAAKAFPDATLLIYHSGFESEHVEGPYDPASDRGVDALVRSVTQHGIGKQGNVYAELGSIWREVMKDPTQAAHVMGKLLKYLGEDRILWGTDAIWYGSPQDQIQAFRAFEISPEFQERFGYPALTREVKAKIFGGNAARVYGVDPAAAGRAHARDPVSQAREEYAERRAPSHLTYGPRTRREMLSFLRATGGAPG